MREPKYAGGPEGRYLLLGATVTLVGLGLVMIWSASSAADFVHFGDGAYHVRKQAFAAVAGLVLMLFAERIDFRRVEQLAWPLWILSALGLAAVLAMGMAEGGSQSWLRVGPMNVQPSEYAKLAVLLLSASGLTRWARRKMTDRELVGYLALVLVPIVGLIMLQPDLGTTLALSAAFFFALMLGGVPKRHLALLAIAGVALACVAVFSDAERASRFFAFLDPWVDAQGDGYQTVQAFLAFGSGGIDGVGLGMSAQKFFYLPAAHTDFILAIIGEELGLLGSLGVVGAFGVFAYAGFRIAIGTRDPFGRLLAGGLTAMIVGQAVMNMAAVTALMPVTGIPLPLVSYGGSSLTFTMGCIGLLLSVSRHGAVGVKRRRKREGERSEDAVSVERRRDGRPHLSGIDGGRATERRRA